MQYYTTLRHLQLVELALVLVEATGGGRIESVSLLVRSDCRFNADLDFRDAEIHWRPETIKTDQAEVYPLPQSVARRAHQLLDERNTPENGECFPKRYKPGSVSPDELPHWLRDLETEIGEAASRGLASLPAEVGEGAETPARQGRGGGRRVAAYQDVSGQLQPAGYRDNAPSR